MPIVASSAIARIDWEGSRPGGDTIRRFVSGQANLFNALVRGNVQVEFSNPTRGVWEYTGVPWRTYLNFVEAGSKGSFFNSNIRGKFPNSRVG